MAVYFDTSLLFKLFVMEPDTPQVLALSASLGQPIVFTDFHEIEFVNALQGKRGRKQISAADVTLAMHDLQAELRRGALVSQEPAWKSVFRQSVRLSEAYASATLCRSLDVMHVAACVSLRVKTFATNDHRQAALAKLAGLHVVQP